jgi:hypothetical protein
MTKRNGAVLAARVVFAAVAALYALYLVSSVWLMAGMYSPEHARVMTATTELPQSDFARFWYVGNMLLVRRAASFGIHLSLSAWFRSSFQLDILQPGDHPEMIWLYPPTMGVLAMLFAALPLAVSFWVWRVATISVAAILLSQAGLEWQVVLAGLASPAEIHDIVGGQNGALMAGLLVGALLLADTRPRMAGALAGLLCIKPQVAMIVPLVLLHRGRWPALAACACTVALMVALSLAAEGWQSWVWFVTVAQPQSTRIMNAPFDTMTRGGFTVLMMARHLHLSVASAWVLQCASSAASALLIWRAWQGPARDTVARMSLTVSLAVLLTPYGFIYDLVGFSVAMAAMSARTPGWRRPCFALLWLAGGYTLSLENMSGEIVMPVAAMLAAALIVSDQRISRSVGFSAPHPSAADAGGLKPSWWAKAHPTDKAS